MHITVTWPNVAGESTFHTDGRCRSKQLKPYEEKSQQNSTTLAYFLLVEDAKQQNPLLN